MELMERMMGLIDRNQLGMLRMRLEALNAPDVAELMDACSRERALLVFRLLPKERAAETFAYLTPEKQQGLIDAMREGEVR
ncbi:MAG: magnesium transporter MgtE N-terminal domain-containing protein, partial [Candidatus Spyradocola sp.]